MKPFLVVGNWKMNGVSADLSEAAEVAADNPDSDCEILICPPAALISRMSNILAESAVKIGGQNCHHMDSGAHTGDISAAMLVDAGADYVIVGHSERRHNHAETNELIHQKILSAWRAGLNTIVCVGETEADRLKGREQSVVRKQIQECVPVSSKSANVVIAYEPVWAIGTGRTASSMEIETMHAFIRRQCISYFGKYVGKSVRILYGGSINAANAASIFAINNVNGALIGGASLKATDFNAVIRSAPNTGRGIDT